MHKSACSQLSNRQSLSMTTSVKSNPAEKDLKVDKRILEIMRGGELFMFLLNK